ncbi:DUF6603 domain-containing protein [Moorena producens]|uniref:DUF6603 domain-containing protein n=1 Tax=Moorena producens TaxID=1155739 RepID=UPI003C714EDE
MATEIVSLLDISYGIADNTANHELTLNERTLGSDLFSLFKQVFHQQTDFRLTNCKILQAAEDRVNFSGIFVRLFPWKNVNVEFTLFDHSTSGIAKQRHSIFRINIPDDYSASTYLSQYNLEPGETVSAEMLIFNPNLEDIIQTIDFSQAAMVFSSVDYSIVGTENIYYPDSLKALLPVKQVKKGINFSAAISFDNDLSQYLAEVFGGSHDEISTSQGLIYPEEYGIYFQFRRTTPINQAISFLSLEMKGISFALPLTQENDSGIRILLDGTVKIKNSRFNITAGFDPYYRGLTLSIDDFPSLNKLIELTDIKSLSDYFTEPLSSMLDIKLSTLEMFLNLTDKSVSQVGFNLTTQDEIQLIENVISIKPTLKMEMYAPFEERFREIEGDLKGIWQLGKTNFETTLYYPSYSFYAGMIQGQSLDMGAVVERILPGIWLPKIQLTKMEVWGNFLSKSFSAEIAVSGNSTWGFELAGRAFYLQSISMRMAYANQQVVGCTMDGTLTLSDVTVYISAEYDTDRRWMLLGATAIEDIINLTSILDDLLEAISLPDRLPDLKLKNIIFSAVPHTSEYSLKAQTAEDWHLTDDLSLKVEEFAGNKRKNVPVYGTLRAVMTIDQTIVRLSAEKAASTDEGWQFEGNTGYGQQIAIGLLIEDLGKKFGEVTLPAAIAELTIQNLGISFNSKTKNFTFTCEAKFPIEGKEVDITVTINITKQLDDSYNKHFEGHITIDDLQFNLIFSKDNTAKTFLATYNNPNGDSLKIKTLVADVSDDIATIIPATLEITLKDALFIYSKRDNKSNFLIGLNLTSQFNLSDLPLVGAKIPPEQTIGVDDLQFLVASQNLNVEQADSFNNLIPDTITKLPLKPRDKKENKTTVIQKGLNASAKLQFGATTEILALPISSDSQPKTLEPQPETPNPDNPNTSTSDNTQPETLEPQPETPNPDNPNTSTSDNAKWFKLQKTFGPVHFERVGVQYQDATLWFLLDAALSASGLTLSLDGLAFGSPLNKFDPKFKLKGIGIDYQGGGAIEIGGAFLRKPATKDKPYDEYDGAAVIKSETFTLSAIGSYTQYDGHPSLFIYAVLDKPLGGPSFFFVTGLAAGFGYNRALKIPTIDQVATFPLVEEAINSNNGSSNTQDNATKLTQELNKLQQYIPPETGQTFLAVGVKFTSFKTIDSFALLTVAFGKRFEVNLLGLSTLVAPPEADKTPVAEVQLALKATFLPDEGILRVRAQLTPNSYILSKKCHLTGGFAFYSWFAPHEHDGDFVLTLGGYHPKFNVPAHYPRVPRLAFNWQVNSELNIKADGYFALTASALMAGGHLQATWHSGHLKAWFKAGADFLIAWKPYHYDASIYVDMGVSYTYHFFGTHHITVDVGADLHIWGPEFTGKAHIHLWCVSFTVSFGAGASQTPQPIDWDKFKSSFLPADSDICSVAVKDGLVIKINQDDKSDLGVINPKHLCLVTNSVIPATDAEHETKVSDFQKFGIGSMAVKLGELTSTHTITITRDGKDNHVEKEFAYTPILKKSPTGLWGESLTPDLNGERFIENTLSGFEIKPKKQPEPGETHPIDRQNLKFTTEPVKNAYEWEDIRTFIAMSFDDQETDDKKNKARKQKINESIMKKTTDRNHLLANLGINSAEIEEINLSESIANDFLISPKIEQVAV